MLGLDRLLLRRLWGLNPKWVTRACEVGSEISLVQQVKRISIFNGSLKGTEFQIEIPILFWVPTLKGLRTSVLASPSCSTDRELQVNAVTEQ